MSLRPNQSSNVLTSWLLLGSLGFFSLTACGDNAADKPQDCVAGVDCPAEGNTDGGSPGNGTTAGATPITAPPETWTWVDFPTSVCGNGVATGLGVNTTTRSKDLLIYLEGGGACWDVLTCFYASTADNITTGYTSADFQNEPFRQLAAADRANAANPFKDMSYVYVPYCTGDVHAGDSVKTYSAGRPTVHHKGARNIEAYLPRLAATFPDVERVLLTGASAGAYGAQLNYERVSAAFPNAEVHLLADCGQMVSPSGSLLTTWMTAWNLLPPAGCPECGTDFTRFPEYLATTYPARRFGLLAYTQDQVLRTFFGYEAPAFEVQTKSLLTARYEGKANARYFLLAGSSHVMLDDLLTITAPGGTTLSAFVTQWLSADASWANVAPN